MPYFDVRNVTKETLGKIHNYNTSTLILKSLKRPDVRTDKLI